MTGSMISRVTFLGLLLLLLPVWAQKHPDAKSAPSPPGRGESPDTSKLVLLAGAAQEVGLGESNIRNARLNNDAEGLAKFFAAGYVTIDENGELLDRTTLLANIKRGEAHFYSIRLSEMEVHRFGPFLYVVTAREDLGGKDDKGADFARSRRFTRVWQKQAVGWRAISSQATPIR